MKLCITISKYPSWYLRQISLQIINTLKTLFRFSRAPFRSLDMYSWRCYKICICSVILGQLESFRNYKGFFNSYFPENLKCNFTYYESENFSVSSFNHIFESENFSFPFFNEKRLTWGVNCEKLNFRKSNGIYYITFENCT